MSDKRKPLKKKKDTAKAPEAAATPKPAAPVSSGARPKSRE